MPIYDCCESAGHPGMRIDSVEFAGLDQRGDDSPVLGSGIVACEECVFSVQSDGADGALDGVVVDLDASVCQEPGESVPVFGDVFERLAGWGFGGDL